MIKGTKVFLRPIEKKDLIFLNKWQNDEEIFRNLGGGFSPVSIDQQEQWMDNMIDQTGQNRRFIICSRLDNLEIGLIGLYSINWIHRTCEIGMYIGEKESHGKGFAGESLNLLEKHAQNYLNIRKIKINVVSENKIGLSFWKKQNYHEVGKYKKERYIKGEYRDLIIMEKFLSE